MKGTRILLCGIGLAVGLGAGPARAQEPFWRSDARAEEGLSHPGHRRQRLAINLDQLPHELREPIARVVQQPTLTAQAPADTFGVNDDLYQWMLDHPDRVSLAWRRLRVPAVEITPLEGGRFAWHDDQGSELVWRTVARGQGGRIWFAEGKVRPGALMPLVPVRAVAVLRHDVERDVNGHTTVRHQLDAYLQTDSKFAALATRMLGPAGPRMAEQGAEQLLFFFSGIARYVDDHPEKASKLLAERH